MNTSLSVAVPWSLSHYMPLNGFHPLYRALFENKPNWVQLAAWDNIELSHKLHGDERFRLNILKEVQREVNAQKHGATRVEEEYFSHFWTPNRTLTRLLPGDIEFHHTAPYPSLERPFVFHCESFAPIFFPFAHQGTGNFAARQDLLVHYKAIFEHPLCLGISSHLPQTIEDLSRFFGSPLIDDRLFLSRIGLYASEAATPIAKGALNAPVVLFINSANQNQGNFFLRGGHLALRYWQVVYPADPGAGRLIMRCARPADAMLAEHGIDLDWLGRHERRSVIWIEDYLSAAELDVLMKAAHFLMLPSASLHSVSIMQAMATGAIPVVSDTLGTERYVTDAVDGIVLRGMCAGNWHRDAETGVMVDRYQRNPELESSLVQQIVKRLADLMADPTRYYSVQEAAIAKAGETFSGKAFSEDFWLKIQQRYQALPESTRRLNEPLRNWPELRHCLIEQADWARIFTSPPQPVTRLHAGNGRVVELGGCFVNISNSKMGLHDWSPLAEFVNHSVSSLVFSADIKGLGGGYLGCQTSTLGSSALRRFTGYAAERLMPYPTLYRMAAGLLKHLRHIRRVFGRYLTSWGVAEKSNIVTLQPDIELVKQGIRGLNVIRCGQLFYAVPQSSGEFSQARAEAGEYDPCVSGSSLRVVLRKVDALPSREGE